MRDSMKYVNHQNEVIEFGNGNILINENKLRDYEWVYLSDGLNLSSFSRKRKETSLPGFVFGENRKDLLNRMVDVFERDILSETPGTIFINGYYTKGYFVCFEKSGYTRSGSIDFSLKFISTSKKWISETKHLFNLTDKSAADSKSYPGKYAYRYGTSVATSHIVNPSSAASDFKMVINGPVVNPSVTIGENTYLVYITLEEGEYLEINSVEKTIYKLSKYGERINVFHCRQKKQTFFNKIASGRQDVKAPVGISVEITLYEERSEPKS